MRKLSAYALGITAFGTLLVAIAIGPRYWVVLRCKGNVSLGGASSQDYEFHTWGGLFKARVKSDIGGSISNEVLSIGQCGSKKRHKDGDLWDPTRQDYVNDIFKSLRSASRAASVFACIGLCVGLAAVAASARAGTVEAYEDDFSGGTPHGGGAFGGAGASGGQAGYDQIDSQRPMRSSGLGSGGGLYSIEPRKWQSVALWAHIAAGAIYAVVAIVYVAVLPTTDDLDDYVHARFASSSGLSVSDIDTNVFLGFCWGFVVSAACLHCIAMYLHSRDRRHVDEERVGLVGVPIVITPTGPAVVPSGYPPQAYAGAQQPAYQQPVPAMGGPVPAVGPPMYYGGGYQAAPMGPYGEQPPPAQMHMKGV